MLPTEVQEIFPTCEIIGKSVNVPELKTYEDYPVYHLVTLILFKEYVLGDHFVENRNMLKYKNGKFVNSANQECSIMFMGMWNPVMEDIKAGKGFLFKETDSLTKAKYQFKILVSQSTSNAIMKSLDGIILQP